MPLNAEGPTLEETTLRLTAHGFRGVYLWGGQATIDLSREKLPDLAIDEEAHRHAYGAEGARLLSQMGINWAFASMNWGFPPEIEREHWAEFERTVATYHDAGLRVLGYVQSSNCVCRGSYAGRDWYALTPSGRRSPYYRRRLMTCWNHPDWIAEVEGRALRIVAAGADGVYFDNLWMGVTPWNLLGRVGGFAGCACERCSAAFLAAKGERLPRSLSDDALSSTYLEWRAGVAAERLSDWASAIRHANARALVMINNCDVVLRDTTRLFGLDLRSVGPTQDALLVENVAMPRHDPLHRRLVANAVVIKAVQATVPGRPVLALPYEHGIGLDRLPSPTRARRTMAEALACGAAPILKGSEFLDDQRRVSVVTAQAFAPLRDAVTPILRFAGSRPELFANLRPDAEVAVLYDRDGMAERWSATAPQTFAVAMSLVNLGVPFRFLAPDAVGAVSGVRCLLVPHGIAEPQDTPLPVVRVPRDLLDVPGSRFTPRTARLLLRLVDRPMRVAARSYFSSSYVRRFLDRTGVAARFLASPLFAVPQQARALGALLPKLSPPHIEAATPVLVERYRRADGAGLVHLVNYSGVPVRLRLNGVGPGRPALHSPDERSYFTDAPTELQLDCYAVLEWPPF